jgi:hypothetical protein
MKEQRSKQAEEFFKTVPLSQRILVTYLCTAIREAAPKANEMYKHKMLQWEQKTGLVAIMAQSDYVFVYFSSSELLMKYSESLRSSLYGKHYLRLRGINDIPFCFEQMLDEAFALKSVLQ